MRSEIRLNSSFLICTLATNWGGSTAGGLHVVINSVECELRNGT